MKASLTTTTIIQSRSGVEQSAKYLIPGTYICIRDATPPFAAQATRDAPTLWERHDAELRKEEAKRIALSTIAERVFGSLGKDRENWRGSAAEKLFDEDERALLGLASY